MTSGPKISRSSSMRNWCSCERGRTRLTTTPSGCSSGLFSSRSFCTASKARCTPETAKMVGSVTSIARSAATSAERVS